MKGKKVFLVIIALTLTLFFIGGLSILIIGGEPNNYQITLDGRKINSGSIRDTFTPRKEYTFVIDKLKDYKEVKFNVYPISSLSYSKGTMILSWDQLYDKNLEASGGGKNITSAFNINITNQGITFKKDRNLIDIIKLYQGDEDIEINGELKPDIDYYQIVINYKEFEFKYSFVEVVGVNSIAFDESGVIF